MTPVWLVATDREALDRNEGWECWCALTARQAADFGVLSGVRKKVTWLGYHSLGSGDILEFSVAVKCPDGTVEICSEIDYGH